MRDFEYVRRYYGVPAEVGRLVAIGGRPAIITADRGHYIGVTFDSDKPSTIHNAHPTADVTYGGMGTPRRLTRSQERYRRYLDVADLYESFLHYLTTHPKG